MGIAVWAIAGEAWAQDIGPGTINEVGPWVTLVSILILAVAGLWRWAIKLHAEVIEGMRRETSLLERVLPTIEVLKQAIEIIKTRREQ